MIDHRDDSLNRENTKANRTIQHVSGDKQCTIYKIFSIIFLTDGPVSREVPESAMAEQPLAQYPE